MEPTQESPYKYHEVFPSPCGTFAIVAIDDEQGEGGFDLYTISDKKEINEVYTLNGVYPTPYWQDRLDLGVIHAIYWLLDEIGKKDNVYRFPF